MGDNLTIDAIAQNIRLNPLALLGGPRIGGYR